MSDFGLVVARKGSTRLKSKNRLDLGGKPLYRWTVDAALESGVLDPVVVSTDDPEILKECAAIPGVVADQRPPELCTDTATALDVLAWMIPRVAERFGPRRGFCLLQPTSPFRGAEDIRRAMGLVGEDGVEFAVGVRAYDSPPFFALSLDDGVHPVNEGALTRVTRTQDVPRLHHPAGGLFAGLAEAFLRERHFYGPASRGVEMDFFAAWDINTAEDFEVARALAAYIAAGRLCP